jgi:tetratricopeptide (TPR) repeat protein
METSAEENLQESTTAPAGREKSSWQKWILRTAIAVLAPMLVLGIVETGLRAGNVGYSVDLLTPCTVHGRAAACYNLFFPAPFFPPGMIKSPQAYSIPAEKPQGTYRIFVLGESAAMGDPDPAYAFSRYLEVMLRERYPRMHFEVVNTGSVAINSHVLLPIAKGLQNSKPDVVIIYSGNNEVVGPYGPGTALTSSGMSLPVIRASIFARSTRIGQLLTKVGTQKRQWGGMEMFMDKQVRAESPLMKYVYDNYEANLRDTIAVARAAGARVIVSTVATNLKDCAPFASLHREDLSPGDLRVWEGLVQRGDAAEASGDFAEALASYYDANKIDGHYAELEFRMARSLSALGNHKEAAEHFQRARDLDTLRFRADSRINAINRSIGSYYRGSELVDSEAILSAASTEGVIGSDLVYEHVHLTPHGNYLLARAMFLQIASKLPSPGGQAYSQADVPSEDDCEKLLAFTDHDRSRISAEMLRRLQEPPFTNQLNHSDQLLRLMMKAQESSESPYQTAAQYQWAIGQNPEDRVLHYNFGTFLFPYDPNAAAQELVRAQPWDGFPVFLPDGTQIQ